MATNRRGNQAYGLGDNLLDLAPAPILAQRAPTNADRAEVGTLWIDQVGLASYTLVSISAGVSTWATTLSSTTVADLTITTGPTDIQAGQTTITSDTDATQAIYLHADGGTSEEIEIRSDQGTGGDSVYIRSDVGGLHLEATGFANAAAIDIDSTAGGVDVDAALQISLETSQDAADAIQLTASDGAGGITATTGTGGLVLATGGVIVSGAATDTQNSPTAASTVNAQCGVVTFTGFTTATTSSEVFTITNNKVSITSGILVSLANLGGNDAQMTVTRVTPAAGSFTVTATNNGAASVNGNIQLSFFVLT